MTKSKYDWNEIQKSYDAGMSQRQLREKYGVHMKSLNLAVKRGDLIMRSRSEANYNSIKQGRKFPEFPDDWRRKTSERQTLHNSGGRCQWYEVHGQRVQGTWERDAGYKLTELGIEWRKCAGKKDIITYVLDGKERRYTPDFYLPAYDIYLEFKGYWWGDDRRKMDAVIAQSDRNIAIIELPNYSSLLVDGVLPWVFQ